MNLNIKDDAKKINKEAIYCCMTFIWKIRKKMKKVIDDELANHHLIASMKLFQA